MEKDVQTFEPLRTEIHQASDADPFLAPFGPAGIARLRSAGREARGAFLVAGLLAIVSLVLSAVLFFGLGNDVLVVWQEGDDRVLVEVP